MVCSINQSSFTIVCSINQKSLQWFVQSINEVLQFFVQSINQKGLSMVCSINQSSFTMVCSINQKVLTLVIIEFRLPIAVVFVLKRRRRVRLKAPEVLTPSGPTGVLLQPLFFGSPEKIDF
jgi:hypothetical protein